MWQIILKLSRLRRHTLISAQFLWVGQPGMAQLGPGFVASYSCSWGEAEEARGRAPEPCREALTVARLWLCVWYSVSWQNPFLGMFLPAASALSVLLPRFISLSIYVCLVVFYFFACVGSSSRLGLGWGKQDTEGTHSRGAHSLVPTLHWRTLRVSSSFHLLPQVPCWPHTSPSLVCFLCLPYHLLLSNVFFSVCF